MRKITANIQNEKGPLNRFFSECIGAGRAAEVMRYVPMKQLEKIQKECPFRYIRFHGIFHEEMNVVYRDEHGNLQFCFQYTDMLFDSLLALGIRPLVELGLMPDIISEKKEYVFWWKMNISMPKIMKEWEMLIEAFLRHITYRSGEEEIKKWYFEVWNEPNHKSFFSEYQNINAYFSLYESTARTVKRVCPDYKVGGPATAGMIWISEMIGHCRENNIPLDFITSHSYGIKGDFDPDGNAIVYLPNIDKVSNEIRHYGKICREAGLPLFITEWSSSFSHTDPIHDSYFNAPYILRAIKRSEGFADIFSYWTYTDIFEENGPPVKPFHGGFGLINTQSLPKPSYYIYTFLHRLGNTELVTEDEDCYICKSDDAVQILLWNIKKPETKEGNRKYFARSLPAREMEPAEISLSGLTPHTQYTVTLQTVGYRSGDVYNAYLDGNFTELPTREETEMLKEASKPKETVFSVCSDGKGAITFSIAQTENSVDFLTVEKNALPTRADIYPDKFKENYPRSKG